MRIGFGKLIFILTSVDFWCFTHAMTCSALNEVNSMIATGGLAFGYGGINPGAQFPHGPLRLGPDTTNSVVNVDYRHFSGYNYNDNKIRAFSHTHYVGAGINGLGSFGVMPMRRQSSNLPSTFGYAKLHTDEEDEEINGWWSEFEKSTEHASPGTYSVYLNTPKVEATLVATGTHSAMHEYVFKNNEREFKSGAESESIYYSPTLVLDICHAASIEENVIDDSKCTVASLQVYDVNEINSYSFDAKVFYDNKFWIYLYGELSGYQYETKANERSKSSLKLKRWNTCSNDDVSEEKDFFKTSCFDSTAEFNSSSSNGKLFSKAIFEPVLQNKESVLQLRVGISFISSKNAQNNLYTTNLDLTLEENIKVARDQWCDQLKYLSVTPIEGDEELTSMLYSASYRMHMSPTIYTESGGEYLGLDQQLHDVATERNELYPNSKSTSPKSKQFYSDLSLWDTFRTANPWFMLTDENLALGILRSMVEMTEQQGGFPKWVLAYKDIGCMIGLHGGANFLEATLSGLAKDELDILTVQKMLLNQATQSWPVNGRKDLDHYLDAGYVSDEADSHSASLTLTYAFDDFVLAGLSAAVGDEENAKNASERAQNYRNLWSVEDKYMCPRSLDGELKCFRTPITYDSWDHFTEGDTLHWSTFVLQDPEGLKSLYESEKDFTSQIEKFFHNHVGFNEKFGSAVPNPYFWAGNEVDSFSPFLLNYASSACTRTQFWTRNITRSSFSATPHGIPGNEDYGAMSSWLLFASLGIFPQPGTTSFHIGSPRVKDANIALEHIDGSVSNLRIITHNNSQENVFVETLLINGLEYNHVLIDRSVLMDKEGCTMEFFMSAIEKSSLC